MRERPIIMSAPMVRAILAGTKSMTRRVVKIKNLDFVGGGPRDGADWNDPSCWGFEDCNTGRNWALASGDDGDDMFVCPYGEPGDRLWVRETWRVMGESPEDTLDMFSRDDIQYRADRDESYIDKYRSSIHMPRWASRITLEIVGVRVERLQDISEADAVAEGVVPYAVYGGKPASWKASPDAIAARDTAVAAYRDLWESINGPGSWDANPWVWVVAFRRVA